MNFSAENISRNLDVKSSDGVDVEKMHSGIESVDVDELRTSRSPTKQRTNYDSDDVSKRISDVRSSLTSNRTFSMTGINGGKRSENLIW